MDRLIALGTGNAQSINYYNTCFLLDTGSGMILCDAGGGNGILRQLRDAGIGWEQIRHVIITHAHSDHMTGVLWVIRMISAAMNSGAYTGQLHLYCHQSIREGMTALCRLSLQPKMHSHIGKDILFHEVTDGCSWEMCGRTVTFFDIFSDKMLQYGFTLPLSDGSRLCCLGDEPFNPLCAAYAQGASWLLCEAFCLYGERETFRPYEKNHSTVKDACELAQSLKVPHLVLWHTEDTHPDRKGLYTAEGRQYYSGDLHVPQDLECIPLTGGTEGPLRVVIAGGRDFTDYARLKDYCDRMLAPYAPEIVIVSGGATGADALGERYAHEMGYPLREYPADWERYGKAAGPIRNREMAQNADMLIAFWDMTSRGTLSMIEEAQKRELMIRVLKID